MILFYMTYLFVHLQACIVSLLRKDIDSSHSFAILWATCPQTHCGVILSTKPGKHSTQEGLREIYQKHVLLQLRESYHSINKKNKTIHERYYKVLRKCSYWFDLRLFVNVSKEGISSIQNHTVQYSNQFVSLTLDYFLILCGILELYPIRFNQICYQIEREILCLDITKHKIDYLEIT